MGLILVMFISKYRDNLNPRELWAGFQEHDHGSCETLEGRVAQGSFSATKLEKDVPGGFLL